MSKDKHDQFSECIEHCEKHEAPGDVIDDGDFQRLSRSVVRKLDLTLLPIVWVLYLFNYIDRNSISQAKLAGLEKDLHLKGDDFNVVVSILNVGYITMQLPSNLILTRVRPSIYLPLFVCIWSAVSASTAAANNYKQLLAIRFILGISEAPFFPGVFYLLSCWYTRRELALRTAILYSGVILATAFSGLIAAGVFAQLEGAQGIASWRWLFIIEGALSFAFGLLALVVLPDFPGKRTGSARWLFNEEEHRVAGLRIERDRTAVEEGSKSVWYGLQLAVKDYRT